MGNQGGFFFDRIDRINHIIKLIGDQFWNIFTGNKIVNLRDFALGINQLNPLRHRLDLGPPNIALKGMNLAVSIGDTEIQ